jgi:hypothetical protein
MPFVVMLYAPDADALRDIPKRMDAGEITSGPPLESRAKTVGIYRWPLKGDLSCRGYCSNKNHMSPWRRNVRGHMECGTCGGRHIHTRKRFIGALLDYLGVNLLPRTTTPKVFQNPDGWGR